MGIIDAPCGQCDECGVIWLLEQFDHKCEICGGVFCGNHMREYVPYIGGIDLAGGIFICDNCFPKPEISPMGVVVEKTKNGKPYEEPEIARAKGLIRTRVAQRLWQGK